ncbi:hypothetical protein SAMN04487910_2599 [Aquimarina amphilecti]|uniref:Tetratricopeptide repeat-containing protein n=1 Tax=Aquimarina amphilecti TaxID=1038014 RepID=A0A1H7QL77_AQUAM|nr:hypothetical protein [Aquimarina amphilecti]SEL48549.1 hypothetical protein SAMN04487910_2599 [Aquimarina amphilecti]
MLEGESIRGVMSSLRNNETLLRPKELLEKENLKDTEGKSSLKKASEEEIQQIGKKIRKENRKEKKILIGIAILITSVFTYFTINVIRQNTVDTESIEILKFQEKEKEFLILIEKGDDWFEKGKWSNSVFYYEQAKEVFQKNYEINYRLVRSYSFQCESEFKNCHKAKELLDKLFLMFPDKEKELLEIKEKLEYEY